jgi:hypothetical protein
MPIVARLVFVAVFVSFATGCGGGKVTLSGKVAVKGQPLAAGSVMVQCPDGTTAVGAVTNGTYTVEGVSPGVVKIAVTDGGATTPRGRGAVADRSGAGDAASRTDTTARPPTPAAKPPSKIPAAVQNLATTTLTHDTATGRVKDLDLR